MESLLLIAVIAYLLGSIPTAYLVCGKKIFKYGSGNVGAMNVYRTLYQATGIRWKAILGLVFTLLCDAAKAFLSIKIAFWLIPGGQILLFGIMIASFFVVLGHDRSVFLRFRGGKGLACLIGVMLALNWASPFICLAVVVCSILVTEAILILMKRSERKLFSITTINSQILGRIIGMTLCFVPVYFLMPQIFPYILPAIFLAFMDHGKRLWNYLKEMKK